MQSSRLGDILVKNNLISRDQLSKALEEQKTHGGRLGEILIRLKMLSDEEVRCALAEHLSTERVHIDLNEIDMNVARIVPEGTRSPSAYPGEKTTSESRALNTRSATCRPQTVISSLAFRNPETRRGAS